MTKRPPRNNSWQAIKTGILRPAFTTSSGQLCTTPRNHENALIFCCRQFHIHCPFYLSMRFVAQGGNRGRLVDNENALMVGNLACLRGSRYVRPSARWDLLSASR